jgi:hypothetical protein
MFKINPNQKRLPLGGHHFYEKGFMIRGETHIEVADKLKDYRLNNNMPIGMPEQDVLFYYALNFPWMVIEDGKPDPVEPEDYKSWRDWIQKTWNRPPKKVITKKEAATRWETCLDCPHNKSMDWPETEESSQFSRKAFLIRRGAEIPENLGYCDLHKVDLGVFTLSETPIVHSEKPKDIANEPRCWV